MLKRKREYETTTILKKREILREENTLQEIKREIIELRIQILELKKLLIHKEKERSQFSYYS